MPRIPMGKTLLKFSSAALLLMVAAGGIFFVFAPYQASRMRANILGRLYASGKPLVLATAEENGAYYQLGDVLRQHLDAYHSYKLEVKATAGSIENLLLLHDGNADLALIQGGLASEREGLVALANVGRQYVHLIVPADSSIQDFRDLAGKRVGVGPDGGGSAALAESVFRFFNFSDDTTLVHDHNPDLEKAFLDGEIDAAFMVYSLFAPAMEQLLDQGWYRLVPVTEAEAVSRYLPGVFMESLPANLYGPDRTIPPKGPFPTLSVNTLLVAQRTLPERQVYTILELIFSGEFLKAARLTDLNEKVAQTALHLPLHPAAEAYYNRNNPISSDRFEILSFFLAGIVCLASVVHYVSGLYRRRQDSERRSAIRPYFEAMMDFGDEIETAGNPTRLTRLIHKIMATQRSAEREWLEGRFDTEDMENLYAVYSLRCNNAFNKIFDLHMQSIRGLNTVQPPRGERSDADSDVGTDALERRQRREVHRDEDEYFSGAALAGFDTSKKELAEHLPSRYDPALLYDTEVSGAGTVRVRKPRSQADLQAVVEKTVPERPMADHSEARPRSRESAAAPVPPGDETPGGDAAEDSSEDEGGADQMFLF